MIVVSVYSYKGGTGRTTLLANIAYQLALAGKRVLCVDFDIDGPGLLHVLQLPISAVQRHNVISLLDYDDEKDEADRRIDVKRHRLAWEADIGRKKVSFDCIPAPMGTERQRAIEDLTGEQLTERVKELCRQAERELDYDFLLIDSSAGFDTFTSMAFAAADLTLVCFRWSEQHIQGTLEASYLLGAMLKKNREDFDGGHKREFSLKDFWLVASGVPDAKTESHRARQRGVEAELDEEIDSVRIAAAVTSLQNGIFKISEDDDLKWLEEIVINDARPIFGQFSDLAGRLQSFERLYSDLEVHQVDGD